MFVNDFLSKINLLGFEFAGETEMLKSMCEGVFLQFNPIKQESRFMVGSSEGQVRSMASPGEKAVLYTACSMFRDYSIHLWVTF